MKAIARHGPWPPPLPHDPSNRVAGSPNAIVLGEHLFNEPRLSADGTMSCGTCHVAGRDWRDGRPKALGRSELDRRTPSLWNVGYAHWFGWDGAGDSLWSQSIRPILDPREMAGDATRVAGLLRGDKAFACGYERAFGEKPGGDNEKLLVDAAKALAAFQATLVSPRTPFDAFRDALVSGDHEAAARYSLAAQRGLKIFIVANCAACHFGPRFTNGEFGDVGIPFFTRPGEVDAGRLDGLAKLANSTGSGPFMHNGHLASLEDVVKHYSEVNPDRLHSDASPLVRPLSLSAEQSADLVAFLRTLSAEAPVRPNPPPLCP